MNLSNHWLRSAFLGGMLVAGASVYGSDQETFNVAPPDLYSYGTIGAPAPGTSVNFVSAGGYSIGKVKMTGHNYSVDINTWLADLRFELTAPDLTVVDINPGLSGFTYTDTGLNIEFFLPGALNGSNPAGTWTLRAYEDFEDGAGPADSIWDTLTVVFTNDAPPPPANYENFDDITTLPGSGWVEQNNSVAGGSISWFQGNTAVFAPHNTAGYLAVNYNSTTGTNTISNWMIFPTMTLNNGDVIKFWTRGPASSSYPDRLQFRMSTNGASSNCGTSPTDVGDFTNLLLDINDTYSVGGYPEDWTQYTVTISGLSGATTGRCAFRYFVENGGPSGANSNYIGIDSVDYFPNTGATVSGVATVDGVADMTGYLLHWSILDGSNMVVESGDTNCTDAAGSYSFSSTIGAGTYTVVVKPVNGLAVGHEGTTMSGSVNLGSQNSLNGDASDDNIVDLGDFDQFAAAFGSEDGDGNWDPNCDFDRNGVVDLGDFDLLAGGFGNGGYGS